MKRTRLPARKRLALRSLALAAVLLVLANYVFGICRLPVPVARQAEEAAGTGHMEVVTQVREPEIGKTMRLYLTANENAVMLVPAYLSICGWMDGGGLALDCSDRSPFSVGWRKLTWRDTDSIYYVFGRVEHPDITRLHGGLMDTVQGGESGGEQIERLGVDTEKASWPEREGAWYFLLRIPDSALPFFWVGRDDPFSVVVTAYDQSGQQVAHVERIADTASSEYGIRLP